MSSNTASSSAGGSGSGDSTAPRRNSKRPKCKKTQLFSFFFCGFLVLFDKSLDFDSFVRFISIFDKYPDGVLCLSLMGFCCFLLII